MSQFLTCDVCDKKVNEHTGPGRPSGWGRVTVDHRSHANIGGRAVKLDLCESCTKIDIIGSRQRAIAFVKFVLQEKPTTIVGNKDG